MKSSLTLLAGLSLLTLIAGPARADDTTTPNAAAARSTFQNMSPEEKQAMQDQARAQAQSKRSTWQQMTPEQKQAKRDAMRSKMQEQRTQFGAGHDRPFGSRATR